MLNSRNAGKYLDSEWSRVRADILKDKTGYTEADRSFHDVTGAQGGGRTNPDTYKIEKTPVDMRTSSGDTEYDIRDNSKAGGAKCGNRR